MVDQVTSKKFKEIYDKIYNDILRFIIIKCHSIDDANDILQETYLEFWKILKKKSLNSTNIKSYLLGIAINKIKKHYTLLQKLNQVSLFTNNNENLELIESISDDFNIESIIIKSAEWDLIWDYIKKKKNKNIPKIFYLHYVLDLSIKEISRELNLGESYIKNSIYRTLKELSLNYSEESDKSC